MLLIEVRRWMPGYAKYRLAHAEPAEGVEWVHGWAQQAAALLRTFTSSFLLHASAFLMGLCYNVAETVTYSEE